jgi:hypothetical protein
MTTNSKELQRSRNSAIVQREERRGGEEERRGRECEREIVCAY